MSLYDTQKRLGVLGGGQLGQMLIPPALHLGIELLFMDKAGSICQSVSPNFYEGSLVNAGDVLRFSKYCDILSIEIENVSCEGLAQAQAEGLLVRPAIKLIELVQDKLLQKEYYQKNHFPTAPFFSITTLAQLSQSLPSQFSLPLVQKMRKSGFDGRGVVQIKKIEDLSYAFQEPSILEKKINFEREVAVLVVRDARGNMVSYPCVEMCFHPEKNILIKLFCPAPISPLLEKRLQECARDLANSLEVIGLLAVEYFVISEDEFLINEIAPRPHNSAHHTIKHFDISQFEMMLRALYDLPLLIPQKMAAYSSMINIFLFEEGLETRDLKCFLADLEGLMGKKNVYPYWYGKKEIRPFRKLGHLTVLSDSYDELLLQTRMIEEVIMKEGA